MSINKPFRRVILWGTEAVNNYADSKFEFETLKALLGDKVSLVEFQTKSELEAYLKGVEDMSGWQKYHIFAI